MWSTKMQATVSIVCKHAGNLFHHNSNSRMGDSDFDLLDGWLPQYAHEACAEVSVTGVKLMPEYGLAGQRWSTVCDDTTVDEPTSQISDVSFWDPTAFAADVPSLCECEDSSFALSGSELKPDACLASQANGEVKGKYSNCKIAKTSSGKHALRQSWTLAEEQLFAKALEVFGPPDVHADPASGRVSVRLGPV